jgi:hypothetical protein
MFIAVMHTEGKRENDPAGLAAKVWDLFDPQNTGRVSPEGVEQVSV